MILVTVLTGKVSIPEHSHIRGNLNHEYYLFQNVTNHDLIFTKHRDDIKDTEYCPPLSATGKKIISKERQGMYNYKTDNYRCFKGFFDGRNWEKLMDDENLDM